MARESVDLQNGSLLKKMLAFALPLMATNALQLMFNAADIAIIGHFGAEHSLAAIGVTPYIVSFLLCFFSGLTVGANVLASVSLGARDFKQTRRIVHTSIAGVLYAAYPLSWGLTTVVLYAVYLPVRRKFPKESVKKAAD